MTKKTIVVLLIEDSAEYAELVRRWLSPQDDMEFVVIGPGSQHLAASALATAILSNADRL